MNLSRSKYNYSYFIVFSILIQLGCGEKAASTPQVCTMEFRYGLNITVQDSLSKKPICDATVQAKDGNYVETLEQFSTGDPCVYVGAGERAGTYSITVQKTGYTPKTTDNLIVEKKDCHVTGIVTTISIDSN